MSVAVPPQAATNHVATAPTASPPGPLKSKHEVLFVFKDRVFHTLLDTGATKSCIDQALVQELQLPIAPAMGKVSFAQAGLSADRIGVTDPLQITSLVPVPSLKMPVRSFSHSFEVLPLVSTTCAYQFIVGTDLLPSLFPAGLPVSFFCPPQPLKGAIIPGAERPHPVQTSTSAALSAAEPGTAMSARPAARPRSRWLCAAGESTATTRTSYPWPVWDCHQAILNHLTCSPTRCSVVGLVFISSDGVGVCSLFFRSYVWPWSVSFGSYLFVFNYRV